MTSSNTEEAREDDENYNAMDTISEGDESGEGLSGGETDFSAQENSSDEDYQEDVEVEPAEESASQRLAVELANGAAVDHNSVRENSAIPAKNTP